MQGQGQHDSWAGLAGLASLAQAVPGLNLLKTGPAQKRFGGGLMCPKLKSEILQNRQMPIFSV